MPSDTLESLILDTERRRNPRFSCGGLAKIICLPSDGIFLPGQIRDLSLGGCSVRTPRPIAHGAVAEILVRIQGSSFRALGQVKAVRGPAGIGMQFLQLSSGGRDMLVELIRELARQQAIANIVRASRQEPDRELFTQERLAAFGANLPPIRQADNVESAQTNSLAVSSTALVVDGEIDLRI